MLINKRILLLKKFLFILIINSVINSVNCFCQWEPDLRLTNAPGESKTSYSYGRCIASEGSYVHAVWFDKRDNNFEIYYKRSTDGGVNWENDVRLTYDTSTSQVPCIAVSGMYVHIVWFDDRDENYEIYYKRSTNGGLNWGADIRMTNDTSTSFVPSISASGLNVHLVWMGDSPGNFELFYNRSTNGGLSWGTETRLTYALSNSQSPSICASGQFVHIAWIDFRDGNYEVYYNRSTNGGLNWGTDIRITYDFGPSYLPSISLSGTYVHIAWYDSRDNNYEIYYISSTDYGLNWWGDVRLTNNLATSKIPSLTASENNVHIVWTEERDGNNEIYYKRSTDRGANWGADTRLTNNPFDSESPSVSVSGQTIHVLWCDDRIGNYEIYYKRNPTGNPIGIKKINSEIPNEYNLLQNYPNPFNSTTTIRFQIKEMSTVKLKVYDLLGEEVANLINKKLNPGTYDVEFNSRDIPSGIYFYRLTTKNYVSERKMVITK